MPFLNSFSEHLKLCAYCHLVWVFVLESLSVPLGVIAVFKAWICSHLDHRRLKLPTLCLWQYTVQETVWCFNNSLGGYNTKHFMSFCRATSAFFQTQSLGKAALWIYVLGRVLCLMYFCPHFCSDFLLTTGCSISQAEASQSVIILFHPMSINLLYSKPLSASYLLPPGHHLKQSHSSFGPK